MFIDKEKEYVFVFKNRKGDRVSTMQYTPRYSGGQLPNHRDTDMVLFGIFENMAPKRIKHHNREPTKKQKRLWGVPEGKWVEWSDYNKKIVIRDYTSEYRWTREQYKKKLQKILEKAREFNRLGIDWPQAVSAARKCGCHT